MPRLTVQQHNSLKQQYPEGTKFVTVDKMQSIKAIMENALGYRMKVKLLPRFIIRVVGLGGKTLAIMDGNSWKTLYRAKVL